MVNKFQKSSWLMTSSSFVLKQHSDSTENSVATLSSSSEQCFHETTISLKLLMSKTRQDASAQSDSYTATDRSIRLY